ncbi:MAG: SHOCT domain-containing protein [Clostridiaceae bacterium]
MIIPWLLGIGLIFYYVMDKDADRDRHRRSRSDYTALEILDRRFASGEINEDEYKLKKKILEDSMYK